MRRPRDTTGTAAVGAVVVALAAAGCGGDEDPDLVNGKTLYVQKCGACHVLERADTRGITGPNLDEAFEAARRDGLGEQTVAGVVREQIANVRRGSKMPPDLVTGSDARDVAAYVAAVAAVPGQDRGELAQAGKPKGAERTARAKDGTLDIDADPTGALAFTAGKATAPAGAIQLVMENPSSIQHNIAVKGPGGRLLAKGAVVGKGGTSKVDARLSGGRYEFVCTVPGHEEGGMAGTLTVR